MEKPVNIEERACFHDARTGDRSLSFYDAITQLTAENQRLQTVIDHLLNRIECLRCASDVCELGSA
jgi:hypothetical protein